MARRVRVSIEMCSCTTFVSGSHRWSVALSRLICLLLSGVWSTLAVGELPLRVAVASNFVGTAAVIAELYTERTGTEVDLIVSSTGKLYAQIVRGAPFDVFLSADQRRPEMLYQKGKLENPEVYAKGLLAFWSKQKSREEECSERAMLRASSRVAIANPEIAPYGEAAKHVLSEAESPAVGSEKITRSESVGQAYSLVAVDAVQVGLVSYAQVKHHEHSAEHCVVLVSSNRYPPIRQAGGVVINSHNAIRAREFMRLLISNEGLALILSAGYGAPQDG